MQKIELLIADNALKAALIEQLSYLGISYADESLSLQDVIHKDNIIVLDDSAADKKNLKALVEIEVKIKNRIVLLGVLPEITDLSAMAEVFLKPIRLGYLIARLQYHSEIAPRLKAKPLTFGDYRLESHARQVLRITSGEVIRLTEKETALLEYLGQREEPVDRDELLGAVWGYDSRVDTHTLETHVYQLRRKLDPTATGVNVLLNERGGYRLRRE